MFKPCGSGRRALALRRASRRLLHLEQQPLKVEPAAVANSSTLSVSASSGIGDH
jgi:hypothetical protein